MSVYMKLFSTVLAPNVSSHRSNGVNERYSGTGRLGFRAEPFAEDVAKSDQYTKIDVSYKPDDPLHQHLYPKQDPQVTFSISSCAGSLRHHLRTLEHCQRATNTRAAQDPMSMDTPTIPVFPKTKVSLRTSQRGPPVQYHSLFAEKGGRRFREFVVFHGEYVYPEYLVAYQRYRGSFGPVR